MVTLTNLRLPISWQTALPQDNNFDISRDQLDDFLEALGPIDWGNTDFNNVGDINGIPVSDFWTDTSAGVLGDLADVNGGASTGNLAGDILYFDGVSWNKLPRGADGQFLKSTSTTVAWGGGSAQINDYDDNLFTVHYNAGFNKAFRFDASLITTTLPTVRTYTMPDNDGTVALLSDIPVISAEFLDSSFKLLDVVGLPATQKRARFDVSGITTGQIRTFTFPNQSGLLALITDIPVIGNTFSDDLFRVYDNVQGLVNPKQIAFQLDQMSVNTTVTLRPLTTSDKTYDIPDANDLDQFLFVDFAQTISNKTIDATNSVDDGALSSNVVFNNQVNTFGVGFRQTFQSDLLGTPGLNVAQVAGNPATLINGDVWINSVSGIMFARINGVNKDLSSAQAVDTSIIITCSDEGTNIDTLNNPKVKFRMPYGYILSEVRASVGTPPIGSTLTVQIQQNNVNILSTPITIDAGEYSSFTASIPPVISTSTLTNDAEIEILLTQVGLTTPGKGLKVTLIGQHV